MNGSVNLSRLLALALLFAAHSAPAFAQQAELDDLAGRLAITLSRSRPSAAPKFKLVVLPFRELKELDNAAFIPDHKMKPSSRVTLYIPGEADEKISQLGLVLANEFADAIARHNQDYEILDPAVMERIRRDELWTEKEMRQEKLAACIARLAGARVVVTGRYERSRNYLNVYVRAKYAESEENLDPLAKRIPFPKQWRESYSQALPAPKGTLELPVPSFPDAPMPDGVFKPGKDGISEPECIKCPTVGFSDEARRFEYMAVVQLGVTVTADGTARDIYVIKPGRYGLTEQAVTAVEAWRFKPAVDSSGKPVPTRILVEMKFRLY